MLASKGFENGEFWVLIGLKEMLTKLKKKPKFKDSSYGVE